MLDTTRRVATPEGIELTLRLAGPVPRAIAWAIDLAIRAAILFAVSMLAAEFVHHRLVEARVEVGAHRPDRLHATLAEQLLHLQVDQLDALSIDLGVAAVTRVERALQVVDDGQELLDRVDDRGIGLVAPLAIDALAIVVEFGRSSQEAVLECVFLAAQLRNRVRLRS